MSRLVFVVVNAVAQKSPQYFPQMIFNQKKKYLMWKSILSSKHQFVKFDALYYRNATLFN
jgi:hypothetical protein